MNELQIRLSADISALQSALTKAKNTIKSFESETEKESEKGNVGFKRKIGLIEQLTNKAKALRIALSQATNENQVAKYNAQLEETSRELTRLNALGRSVSANLGSTAGGFGQVARQGANANSVALEFNRIIQDAPFGLIGIGNNLQQLAGNFSQVSKQAGGAGKAISASLASIVSPVNLGLLAISALTAGFTAYQMGAFDFVTATDEAKTAQEEFNESLKDTEQTLKQGFFNELLKAQGLLKTENLGGRLVDVPAFQTANEVLQKLGSTINSLNKNELEALESFLSQRLADAARASANATSELEKSLANTDVLGYQQVLTKVNEQLKFYEDDTKKSTKATKELKQEISTFSTDPLVDAYFKAIEASAKFRESIDQAAQGVVLDDPMLDVQSKIAQALLSMGPPVKEFADQYKLDATNIQDSNRAIIDSFSSLGTGIVSSLDISNNALRGFLATLLSAIPKIVGALLAQAAASKAAAAINNQANAQQAAGAAVATAAEGAKGLGPVGIYALPVFIAGALALISGAFSKIGGGASVPSGGGGSVGAPPQIFTNAPQSFIPNTGNIGSGSSSFNPSLKAEIGYDSLTFYLDQYKEGKSRS